MYSIVSTPQLFRFSLLFLRSGSFTIWGSTRLSSNFSTFYPLLFLRSGSFLLVVVREFIQFGVVIVRGLYTWVILQVGNFCFCDLVVACQGMSGNVRECIQFGVVPAPFWHVHFGLQVGHPPSESTFCFCGLIIFTGCCQGPAISAHFWPQLMYTFCILSRDIYQE